MTYDEPNSPPNCGGPDRVLLRVIIDARLAVLRVPGKWLPAFQEVVTGLDQGGLREHPLPQFQSEIFEPVERPGIVLSAVPQAVRGCELVLIPERLAFIEPTEHSIVRAGCMAHARRGFVEALESGDDRATPFLVQFGALYEIEAEGRPLDPNSSARMRTCARSAYCSGSSSFSVRRPLILPSCRGAVWARRQIIAFPAGRNGPSS